MPWLRGEVKAAHASPSLPMQPAVRAVQAATAPHVLRLYRSIMRYGKSWPNQTDGEFIRMEARELFKRNKSLTDPADIERKIVEADTRVALALHYKNPHPRPFYGPPGHSPERIRSEGSAVRPPPPLRRLSHAALQILPQYMDSLRFENPFKK